MFRYIIIIIIYEVPSPGRAEKNGAENKKSCQKEKVVPKIKSRAKKKKSCQKKSHAEKKKVVPKKKGRAEKNSRAREN